MNTFEALERKSLLVGRILFQGRRALELLAEMTESTDDEVDVGPLVDCVEAQTALVAECDLIDRALPTDDTGWRSWLAGLNGQDKARAEQLIERLAQAATQAESVGREVEQTMASVRDDLGKKLGRVRAGERTLEAYAPFKRKVPRYIDRKG